MHLHPARHLHVHVQDRHHLVPLRRPELRDEVRQLDVQRVQCEFFSKHRTSCDFICNFPIQLDFQLASESGDMSTYVQNGEWDLKGHHQPCFKSISTSLSFSRGILTNCLNIESTTGFSSKGRHWVHYSPQFQFHNNYCYS